ncbi:reverse transcriptase domain-containing protein [Tanacetum coccineum]
MDACMKGPQLEEGENLNTGAPGTGRTPPGGTSAPAGQAQGGPSLAFVKENIDVLRTMIKELDNRGQEKVTPRKLFNEESGGARSENSQMSPLAEEVGGYSSDGSSRSRSREAQSRSKSKSIKSKPQSVRASQRKSSSDSGYDTVFDSGSEDLSIPYRRPKPMPFTSRITPEQEEWPMPVWCKMFRQTLSGSARNWFDSLDPKSIDGFEELSNKFLEEFSQQNRYGKDPTEIYGIKQKPNEGLRTFMDRFKAESTHIKGVPPVLRIFAFMHGHDHPKLAKKLNDKIPKIVDEMWERVRAFIRRGTVADTTKFIISPRWEKSAGKAIWSKNHNGSRNRSHRMGEGRNMGTCAPYARREGFTPLTKTPKEILAMDNVNFPPPPPMVGTPKKRNMNKFCDYHQDRGHNTNDCYHLKKQIEEAVASGRLAHLVKDIRQGGQKSKGSAKGKEKVINMNGMRSLGAVASTIHSMIKFPTSNGIATIATTRETLRECRQIEEAQALSRHARVTDWYRY